MERKYKEYKKADFANDGVSHRLSFFWKIPAFYSDKREVKIKSLRIHSPSLS